MKSPKKPNSLSKENIVKSPSRNTWINISGVGIKSQVIELSSFIKDDDRTKDSRHKNKWSNILSSKLKSSRNNSRPLSASNSKQVRPKRRFWLKVLRGKKLFINQTENQNRMPKLNWSHKSNKYESSQKSISDQNQENNKSIDSSGYLNE